MKKEIATRIAQKVANMNDEEFIRFYNHLLLMIQSDESLNIGEPIKEYAFGNAFALIRVLHDFKIEIVDQDGEQYTFPCTRAYLEKYVSFLLQVSNIEEKVEVHIAFADYQWTFQRESEK